MNKDSSLEVPAERVIDADAPDVEEQVRRDLLKYGEVFLSRPVAEVRFDGFTVRNFSSIRLERPKVEVTAADIARQAIRQAERARVTGRVDWPALMPILFGMAETHGDGPYLHVFRGRQYGRSFFASQRQELGDNLQKAAEIIRTARACYATLGEVSAVIAGAFDSVAMEERAEVYAGPEIWESEPTPPALVNLAYRIAVSSTRPASAILSAVALSLARCAAEPSPIFAYDTPGGRIAPPAPAPRPLASLRQDRRGAGRRKGRR